MGAPSNVGVTNLPHQLVPVSALAGGSHQTLAVGAAATDTSSIVLADTCRHVQVQVETADVRQTVNGTTPTASLGTLVAAGTLALMSRAEWSASKWIRKDAADAVLQIAQYN